MTMDQVNSCQDLRWAFWHGSFETTNLPPQRVYIYNADSFACMFYMSDQETGNPDSYG